MSQTSNHIKQHQIIALNMTQMASIVTKSRPNRAPLDGDGMGDSRHTYAVRKSAATL